MTPVLEAGTMVEVVEPQELRDSVLEVATEIAERHTTAASPLRTKEEPRQSAVDPVHGVEPTAL